MISSKVGRILPIYSYMGRLHTHQQSIPKSLYSTVKKTIPYIHPSASEKPLKFRHTFSLRKNCRAATELHLKYVLGEMPKNAMYERKLESFYRCRPKKDENISSILPKMTSFSLRNDGELSIKDILVKGPEFPENIELMLFDRLIEGIDTIDEKTERKLNDFLFNDKRKKVFSERLFRSNIHRKLFDLKAYDLIVELIETYPVISDEDIQIYIRAQLKSSYANPLKAKALADYLTDQSPDDFGTVVTNLIVNEVFINTLKNQIDQLNTPQKYTQVFEEFKFCYPNLNPNDADKLELIYLKKMRQSSKLLEDLKQ